MINPNLVNIKSNFSDLTDNVMHMIFSESKDSVYLYETASQCLKWLGGKKDIFGTLDLTVKIPEDLLEWKDIHAEGKLNIIHAFEKVLEGECQVSCTFCMRADQHNDQLIRMAYRDYGAGYAVVVFSEAWLICENERKYFYEEQFQNMLSEDIIAVSKVNLTENRIEYIWGANIDQDQLFRLQTYEQMYQTGIRSIHGDDYKERYEQIFEYHHLLSAAEKGEMRLSMEYSYENQPGIILWAMMSATIVKDAESGHLFYYSFIRDIDQKKRAELLLRNKAEKDSLTGLYNKETSELMIRQEINRNRHQDKRCVMMVMDIDHFKSINDTYGHPYGDYVLSQVGSILSGVFGDKVLKGRFGGDEFIVFAVGIQEDDFVFQKTEQMKDVLQHAFFSHSGGVRITLSIGITFSNTMESDFEILYHQADKALYTAKHKGKNQYSVFENEKNQV